MSLSLVQAQDVDLSGLEDELLSIEKSQMNNAEAVTKIIDEAAVNDDNLEDVVANEYISDQVKTGLSGLERVNEKAISESEVKNSIPSNPSVKTRRVRSR